MLRVLSIVALGALVAAVPTPSQAKLELPAPSPLAKVFQTVGVTEIEVQYSSPGVKGRKIFGGLVPLAKLWRTGANRATRISFSRDVLVAGQPVPAGTYAIFTIPGAKKWTFILNKDADQGGTRKYSAKLDQLRVQLAPSKAPFRERMTFLFAKTKPDATRLDLEWDKTRLSIPITIKTADYAKANIDTHTDHTSRSLANAARYYGDTLKQWDQALAYIDMSIAVKKGWFNTYLKAHFLASKGDYKAAVPLAEQAWEMGNKAEYFFWKERVEESLAAWKKKKK